MFAVCDKYAYILKILYRPAFGIAHRITKHLDKSGFDEVVQFSNLLLTLLNDSLYFPKNPNNFCLLIEGIKIKFFALIVPEIDMGYCCASEILFQPHMSHHIV